MINLQVDLGDQGNSHLKFHLYFKDLLIFFHKKTFCYDPLNFFRLRSGSGAIKEIGSGSECKKIWADVYSRHENFTKDMSIWV